MGNRQSAPLLPLGPRMRLRTHVILGKLHGHEIIDFFTAQIGSIRRCEENVNFHEMIQKHSGHRANVSPPGRPGCGQKWKLV